MGAAYLDFKSELENHLALDDFQLIFVVLAKFFMLTRSGLEFEVWKFLLKSPRGLDFIQTDAKRFQDNQIGKKWPNLFALKFRLLRRLFAVQSSITID